MWKKLQWQNKKPPAIALGEYKYKLKDSFYENQQT
jgi:hypothetical protein